MVEEHSRAIESRLELRRMDQTPITDAELQIHMKLHQVSYEEREQFLDLLLKQQEAASMGDDTPMAVSQKHRLVSDYLDEVYAGCQPTDRSIAEAIVMSLNLHRCRKNVFSESPLHAKRVILSSQCFADEIQWFKKPRRRRF